MMHPNQPKQKLSVDISRKIIAAGSYDTVVCGGGPAGVAAALSARRAGLSVLLVEMQGQLGGIGTSGLVAVWLGGRTGVDGTGDGRYWVVGGIFREIAERAAAEGIALIPRPDRSQKYQPHGWFHGQLGVGVPFDADRMTMLLDDMVLEAGIDLLFQTQVVAVRMAGNRISQVIVANKSGLQAITAATVIDATGDADVAAMSSCKIRTGRDEDNLMTPATLAFHVSHVDQDELAEYITRNEAPRFRKLIQKLRQQGEWPFPYDIFISLQLNEKGTMLINTSRLVGVDGTDAKSITHGFIDGRRETRQLMEIMRRHFPGFKSAKLKAVASQLGIRETRRIQAEYELTVNDILSMQEFPDTIGLSAYCWDLPDPKKPSYQPFEDKQQQLRKRPYTPIPYRIMVPQPVENLICPGRAVSVERDVLGPLRVMAPVMAMGEAAGLAAAQLISNDSSFAAVDIPALRTALKQRQAIVDWQE